jgi:hypothetical protein
MAERMLLQSTAKEQAPSTRIWALDATDAGVGDQLLDAMHRSGRRWGLPASPSLPLGLRPALRRRQDRPVSARASPPFSAHGMMESIHVVKFSAS